VALSIPELNQPEEISRALDIPLSQVRAILTFLIKTGMAVPHAKDPRAYAIGPKHIHLGADSTHIRNHHINWRVRTIQTLDTDPTTGLHYSSAVTLSRNDVEKIKEMLISNLKSMNNVISASKEEVMYGLNFDFFKLADK
jgi:sugar-specific transcriptional regulator TrmB